PSLSLMEAANRLLGEADAMDSNEIVTLMDSFPTAPTADPDQQWQSSGNSLLLQRFLSSNGVPSCAWAGVAANSSSCCPTTMNDGFPPMQAPTVGQPAAGTTTN
ncbi:MAG TPA: hypothetical protein DD643_03465, partial [Synechococcus sp. UBA8638]|nr:hypothetical protein [Synechococcus sp. UBA8638]